MRPSGTAKLFWLAMKKALAEYVQAQSAACYPIDRPLLYRLAILSLH
jgi:hypothetical protein